jgi:hypothetical protein
MMGNWLRFVAVTVYLLFLSSCGGGGSEGITGTDITSGGNTTGLSATSVRTAASDALFTNAANPVNVTVVPDAARAVSQDIGPAGGIVSASGADGSQYTLDIPANALPQSTTITMMPISSVVGLPLDSFVAGVQFAPEGLLLMNEAKLTIVPTVSVPVGSQTFLGYSGTGNDLHLVPPASAGQAIQMLIGHFSGGILGSGTPAQRGAFYQRLALDAEARLDQEVARDLGQSRQRQLLGVDDGSVATASIENYDASYWALIVQNYLAAAKTSCNNAKVAQKAYLGFMRRLAILGLSDNPYDPDESIWKQLVNDTDSQCNSLPNRYSGSFTFSGPTGDKVAGTVTFLRNDAACQAAGEYTNTTACYVAESVTYTDTPAPPAGCTLSQQSGYKISLTNTPASDAYLRIDLAPTNNTYSYQINALWMQTASPPLMITCGTFSYDAGYYASGAINSGPNTPHAVDVQQLNGSFKDTSGLTYTWTLAGGA